MTGSSGNLLADNFTEGRSAALDLLWIFSFSLLTALLAQVAIPLPFTPVPLTGQTFGVLAHVAQDVGQLERDAALLRQRESFRRVEAEDMQGR